MTLQSLNMGHWVIAALAIALLLVYMVVELGWGGDNSTDMDRYVPPRRPAFPRWRPWRPSEPKPPDPDPAPAPKPKTPEMAS